MQPSNDNVKARLVLDEADKPVQLLLTARQAADLAVIVDDFAKEVVPNCAEVEGMIRLASALSAKLEDLVMARAMMVGEKTRNSMAAAG